MMIYVLKMKIKGIFGIKERRHVGSRYLYNVWPLTPPRMDVFTTAPFHKTNYHIFGKHFQYVPSNYLFFLKLKSSFLRSGSFRDFCLQNTYRSVAYTSVNNS